LPVAEREAPAAFLDNQYADVGSQPELFADQAFQETLFALPLGRILESLPGGDSHRMTAARNVCGTNPFA
jgi:hypothetical protein